ncbi:MAG: zinc-binding dehydrogenase [Proteobacteria bacterium]|nr:zinc-binding dehydrogenase [Pseudomonadota bacterium]MDA1059265.1 zinc-binding dehydrogenase [Pseudomonadota bacterium]
MKAIVIDGHGGADKLSYQEIPAPEVGPGDVLIKIDTVGINRFDTLVRNGNVPNASVTFPHVLGVEGAGTVAEVGAGVIGFSVGDRVVPVLTVSQGRCNEPVCYCMQGHDNICAKFDKLGHTRWGTYAEYVRVNQFSLLPLPDEVSFLDAATSLVAYATAWEMARKVNLRPEDTVLINAVGGAVGSAAVQIAHMTGCRIVASAGSDDKLRRAQQDGADVGVNYRTQNLTKEARAATGGRGVDVVLETVGGDILRQSLDALAYNGRLSSAGSIEPTETLVDIRRLLVRSQIVMTGTHFTPKESIKQVLRFLARGDLRPVLAARFPLSDARKAHELLESRDFYGNIVLEV